MSDLKLPLEFIPMTMEDSLYKFLKKSDRLNKWKRIKEDLRNEFGNKCHACQVTSSHLEAHEVWHFDDDTCVQLLMDIQLLCKMCHRVKHLNLFFLSEKRKWGFLAMKTTKQDLIDHFCNVNECDEAEFTKHEAKAYKKLRVRNRIRWKRDFSSFYKPIYDKIMLKYHLTSVDFI